MNVHVTISAEPGLLERFDAWWKTNEFKSRSDALAYLMKKAVPEAPAGEDDPYGS